MVENASIVSIASGSPENARAAAEASGAAHSTGDWRETVSHPDVDLVCITTPPLHHREMTLAALAAGKHVLCEKPMAMNVAEAEEMCAAARSADVLALIDHELRFQDGRQKAYAMLREGRIGKIRHVKAFFRAPHRGDPNIAWNWWSDLASGGGALGAIGTHVIDSFNWLLGTSISRVFCQLEAQVKTRRDKDGVDRAVTSDDEANLILRFADSELTSATTGVVSLSMTEGPSYKNILELHGTLGSMKIDANGGVSIAPRGEKRWQMVDTDLGHAVEGVADTGFSRGFVNFAPKIVEAISESRRSIEYAAAFEDGLAVQRVIDAAHESNDTGKAVEL
ncbi:MAG: oxidoreductase domain-containing protein [Acidobacteria bacterium OLB17]|nr:MAG: oxidoreductase domain-containing protein [Acidobacteria bacterium OLB17]